MVPTLLQRSPLASVKETYALSRDQQRKALDCDRQIHRVVRKRGARRARGSSGIDA
jgi:hypothetical protein